MNIEPIMGKIMLKMMPIAPCHKKVDWAIILYIMQKVPVGFVNVEASKELIMETDIPYIVAKGRKGGSNIAAAICNALLLEAGK